MQLWNGVRVLKLKVVRNVLYLGGTERKKYCTAEVLVFERRKTKMFCFQELLQRKMFYLLKYLFQHKKSFELEQLR